METIADSIDVIQCYQREDETRRDRNSVDERGSHAR